MRADRGTKLERRIWEEIFNGLSLSPVGKANCIWEENQRRLKVLHKLVQLRFLMQGNVN